MPIIQNSELRRALAERVPAVVGSKYDGVDRAEFAQICAATPDLAHFPVDLGIGPSARYPTPGMYSWMANLNPVWTQEWWTTIERGDWVAIAGDRTPVRGDERISTAPFLGHDAPFPQGPYILAHLLECPVYLMFCIRQNGVYRLYFEMFAERIKLPRRDKQAAIEEWAARYANRLEYFCLIDPYQWYNFYDFWQTPHSPEKAAAQ